MNRSVVILYPEPLSAALSNLAVHFLFSSLSSVQTVDIFTYGTVRSLFFRRKLNDFDVILVSFSYEYSLFHLAEMLEKAGIPLASSEREIGRYPLIIAGGPVVSLRPKLFVSIADIVVNGEGEVIISDILELVNGTHEQQRNAGQIYSWAATSAHPQSERVRANNRAFGVYSDERLLCFGNEFGDRVIVEVNRGCTAACRFCVASYLYRPFRAANHRYIMRAVELAQKSGRGIALMGTSVADYPEFDDLLDELVVRDVPLSLSSLKGGAITENRLQLLKKNGVRTVTVAIESADPSVRKRVGKPLSQESIMNALALLARYRFKVKTYFIAGLPGTTAEAEIAAISDVFEQLARRNELPVLSISVAPLSPKPLTPFEREPMMGKTAFRKYVSLLRNHIKSTSYRAKLFFSPYREAVVQTWVTSASSESLLSVLRAVARGMSIRDAERFAGIKMEREIAEKADRQ